jgi:ribose transport system ATP-binding protein
MKMSFLLEMKDISKSYSGIDVLKRVSFNLSAGEVHVLLGENGAGKSTLIKILSGAEQKTSGKILIEGNEVEIKNPLDGLKQKIRVIYQELNLNDELSIAENIFLGNEKKIKRVFVDWRETMRKAKKILMEVGLHLDPAIQVRDLSIAQKQMVELSKALIANTKILVLDEPTAALTENEKETLFKIIIKLKNEGIGIIYISHRLKEMFEIGNRVTILRNGELVKTLHVGDVDYDEIIHLMIGKNVVIDKKDIPRYGGENILEVEKVSDGGRVKNVSFCLKAGLLLGVTGLVGSGRTELAKCIIGTKKLKSGSIKYKGKLIRFKSPHDAAKKGIVYVSEDRKAEGLIMNHSVKDNVLLPNLKKTRKFGFLNGVLQTNELNGVISRFMIKVTDVNAEIRYLSGGNQQKVSLAKWISHGADIYIIDEPTRGIDLGARRQIYDIIDELVDSGASVIMITSDIVELLKMSDQILILKDGKSVALFDNTEKITQSVVLHHALGIGA